MQQQLVIQTVPLPEGRGADTVVDIGWTSNMMMMMMSCSTFFLLLLLQASGA
jgi:hypothetical protein